LNDRTLVEVLSRCLRCRINLDQYGSGSRNTGNPETRKSRAASRRYEASAAFAAIVAWAHQTSSSKADFVAVAELVEEGIEAERVSREQLRQSSWGLDSVEEDALADIVHGN
jgi:hypothetical protein